MRKNIYFVKINFALWNEPSWILSNPHLTYFRESLFKDSGKYLW